MTDTTPTKRTRARKATTTPEAPAQEVPAQEVPAKKTRARKAPAKAPTHPGKSWAKTLADKGLSQTQAAKAMGVAPMTLNRLINGQGVPTAKVCVLFARATEQDVHAVWTEVANYELELAVAANAAK